MTRKCWTRQEDDVLTDQIRRHGDKRGREGRWQDISKCLPGRTAKAGPPRHQINVTVLTHLQDCRKRWFHSLDPSLRKGRWTKDEDQVLLQAYARLGPAWKRIALLLPGRKDDQCSKRYTEILAPSVNRRLQKWNAEEDDYLCAKVRELGHRWSIISAGLPGRPPLTCRNRWRALSKKIADGGHETGAVSSGAERVSSDSGMGGDGGEAESICAVMHHLQQSQLCPPDSLPIESMDFESLGCLLDDSNFNLDAANSEISRNARSDLAMTGQSAPLHAIFNTPNPPNHILQPQSMDETLLNLDQHLDGSTAQSYAEAYHHSDSSALDQGISNGVSPRTCRADNANPGRHTCPSDSAFGIQTETTPLLHDDMSDPSTTIHADLHNSLSLNDSLPVPEEGQNYYRGPDGARVVEIHHHVHHYHHHYHFHS